MIRVAALLAFSALALSGCTAGPGATAATAAATSPAPRTVTGFVEVALTAEQFEAYDAATDIDPMNSFAPCVSPGTYSDVADGAQITATDPSGEIVAIGSLDAGQYDFVGGAFYCEFQFTIEEMVLSEKFYGLSVGNVFRGDVQFTEKEMRVGPRLYLG